MKKKLARVFAITVTVLVVALLIAFVAVMFFTNSTVGKAISMGASQALGVDVSLKTVKLSPFRGQMTLDDLVVKNPEGYENQIFLDLKHADIALRTETLLTDTVRVEHMELKGVRVVMEQKGLTTNIQEIVNTINQQADAQPSGKKMVIEVLDISDITVKVKLIPLPGKIDTVPLKLAPMRLTNLGEDKPLNMAKLTSRIILAIVGGIVQQAIGILPDDLVNAAGAALGTTTDLGKHLLSTGAGVGGSLIKGAEKMGGSLIDGLLFKKNKDANTPQE
ncbi:MAG: AsmA family protein [Phycisphaerae bacterium]|nr:AsmA family protein [Phycisphaerae bacterium]